MPYINIQTKKTEPKMNTRAFAYALADAMNMDIKRINIIVNYFEEEESFIGSGSDYIYIHVWVSESNGKDFMNLLIKQVESFAKVYLSDSKSIAVICNPVQEGNMAIFQRE